MADKGPAALSVIGSRGSLVLRSAIREFRRRFCLTQQRVASELGISLRHMQRIEAGAPLTRQMLVDLVGVLRSWGADDLHLIAAEALGIADRITYHCLEARLAGTEAGLTDARARLLKIERWLSQLMSLPAPIEREAGEREVSGKVHLIRRAP